MLRHWHLRRDVCDQGDFHQSPASFHWSCGSRHEVMLPQPAAPARYFAAYEVSCTVSPLLEFLAVARKRRRGGLIATRLA